MENGIVEQHLTFSYKLIQKRNFRKNDFPPARTIPEDIYSDCLQRLKSFAYNADLFDSPRLKQIRDGLAILKDESWERLIPKIYHPKHIKLETINTTRKNKYQTTTTSNFVLNAPLTEIIEDFLKKEG